MRLNQFIALCSNYSRRSAEKLILAGKITINGQTTKELATRVNPETDRVKLADKILKPPPKKIYLALHKPAGYLCTCQDTHHRQTILDLIPKNLNVHPIGRLDQNTEGLIVLTNDGELTLKLTHPRFHHPKEYLVKINGPLTEKQKEKIKTGICLDGFKTLPAKLAKIEKNTWRLTIFEGKKRQIKEMFKALGHQVIYLKRLSIGQLELGSLPRGKYRFLNQEDLKKLINHESRI